MTRVTHFSDWHGQFDGLPSSDIYVCTGDMYPNSRGCMWADKNPERMMQEEWAKEIGAHRMVALLKPGSTVVCVRGNHDYTDLARLFHGHDGKVIELFKHEKFELAGLTWGGFRGVLPISGEWADEMGEREIEYRCDMLGKVDVLVTHAPALGCRDGGYGSSSIEKYISRHKTKGASIRTHSRVCWYGRDRQHAVLERGDDRERAGDKMSILEITDENGTCTIDMNPVEKYADGIEAAIAVRKFSSIPQRVDALKHMSQEQLVHLASLLTCKVAEYARLYDSSFSKEHVELVEQMRVLRRAANEAGEDLWPELK